MVGVSSSSVVLRDPESTERELGHYFPDIRLGRIDREVFSSRFATTAGPHFSIVDYGIEAPGAAVGGSDHLVVIMSGGTGYRLAHGRSVIDTSRPFLSPAEGLAGCWESFSAVLVSLDIAQVERVARTASGDEGFRLTRTGTAPVSADHARHWNAVVAGFRRTLELAPDAFDSSLVAEGAFHHLATALLHAFHTSWLDVAQRSPEPRAGSSVVRRALEYLQEHAGDPITVQQVAEAAFISTRGLHYAFTRELGESPTEVLRRIRLERARADLAASDRSVTVAAVARRWGFAHPSRFAQAYLRAFGEYPADTLRR